MYSSVARNPPVRFSRIRDIAPSVPRVVVPLAIRHLSSKRSNRERLNVASAVAARVSRQVSDGFTI